MAELADAGDSKSPAARCPGSSPGEGTTKGNDELYFVFSGIFDFVDDHQHRLYFEKFWLQTSKRALVRWSTLFPGFDYLKVSDDYGRMSLFDVCAIFDFVEFIGKKVRK